MASDASYRAVDHGGLEVAYNHASGLEVARGEAVLPEVVPPSRSSLDQPETLHTGQYGNGGQYVNGGNAPPYTGNESSAYYASLPDKERPVATPVALESGKNSDSQSYGQKRYCGMSKKAFVISLIIAIVVVVAAVLGGVLGGVLSHSSSSSSSASSTPPTTPNLTTSPNGSQLNSSTTDLAPLSALSSTGLATVLSSDGTGRLLTYYQDPSGRIIENSYLNGEWSLQDQSQINSSVVTTSAQLGTSLAAVSYNLSGASFRQLFFLSEEGHVRTVNSSSTSSSGVSTAWTTPYTVARDKAISASIAMAACADTTPGGMTGIRMYYGSQNGSIQEVGFNFSQPTVGWTEWEQIQDSDPNSGVACTIDNTGKDRFISVYFRNSTLAAVQQQWWNYRYQNGWTTGPSTTVTIPSGSDIAACTDGQQTDYVLWQIPGGTITRALVSPAGTSNFLTYDNQQSATVGTRLAAAYLDGGSFYMYQNESSQSTMWASDISRSGAVISNIAIS